MITRLIPLTCLIIIGFGCTNQLQEPPMSDQITFTTSDGITIVGTYQRSNDQKGAILLHMMPADRTSWITTAQKLDEQGYASLAIDERGHGESTMNGILNYKNFTDEEQQAKILDAEAALTYLLHQGFSKENIVVMGASIGANLAIQLLTRHPELPLAIALSPGLNYRGIKTDELITQLHPGQKVILVASEEDVESFESARTLQRLNPSQTVLIERKDLGHGTTMTDKDPALLNELLSRVS